MNWTKEDYERYKTKKDKIPSSFALGRMKAGKMNKTEVAYADYLEVLKRGGEVLWYALRRYGANYLKGCKKT